MDKYYNISKVKKIAEQNNSNFIFIYGGKSKGKSYQAKSELMINHYLSTGQRFCLLRRYEDEVDKTKTELYFRDFMNLNSIEELTDGRFNNIQYQSAKIYFVLIENKKVVDREHIGYAIALNCEQNYSSILSEQDIDYIIFEEFQSRKTYLTLECEKLDFLYSTIDRERGTTKIFFLGNAISKSCPYWDYYGLTDIIKTQKNGTIETHIINGKNILCEKTRAFNTKRTTVGHASGAIANGDWFSIPQLHTKMKGHKRRLIYINFEFNTLKFIGELNVSDTGKPYWFIWEVDFFKDTKNTFTVTNKLKPSANITNNIYNFSSEKLNKITNDTFRKNNIYFSTDECGTDFYTAVCFRVKEY